MEQQLNEDMLVRKQGQALDRMEQQLKEDMLVKEPGLALDRMEQQLKEDMMVRKHGQAQENMEQQLNKDTFLRTAEILVHESESANQKEMDNLHSNDIKWQSEGTGKCESGQEEVKPEESVSF